MIKNIDKKMIKLLHDNIRTNGTYPNFGSPETKCAKCMFYMISCFPSPQYVGCLGGWKKEEEF